MNDKYLKDISDEISKIDEFLIFIKSSSVLEDACKQPLSFRLSQIKEELKTFIVKEEMKDKGLKII